jgi:MoaA/NifB/PqqE/SkfB family radical SAM enzyme
MAKDSFPLLKGKARSEPFGGMIFSTRPNVVLVTNATGYKIANGIDGKTSVDEISSSIAAEYRQPKWLVQRDVQAFLDFLSNQGILNDRSCAQKHSEKQTLHKHQSMPQPLVGMYDYELSAPMSILIEITRKCNLKCLHCFSNSGKINDKHELTTIQWKRFIDTLANMHVFFVFFGGGEPLCRKDFMDIAAHTRRRGMDMCLLSNLTLVDAEIAQRLRDVGFYKIEGNLDGPNAEIYENLRQTKGSFEKTVNGIRNCVSVGLPVRVNCTLTRLNYEYIEDIISLAFDLGVTDIAFIRLIPAGRGDKNFVNLDFGEDFYRRELVPKLHELRLKYRNKIDVGFEQENELIKLHDPNNAMPWCGSGRIHCTVTSNGDVKPDHSFPDSDPNIIAGNILKNDFEIIWRESSVFKIIRQTKLAECLGCKHIQCAGGDVYRIYRHYGRLMGGKDPRCLETGGKCYF